MTNQENEHQKFNESLNKIQNDRAKTETEIAVCKHQLIRMDNRLNNLLKKQRTARTHRLIVEGAELEYVFDGIENLPQQMLRDFLQKLKSIPGVMKLFEESKASLQSQPSNEKVGDT